MREQCAAVGMRVIAAHDHERPACLPGSRPWCVPRWAAPLGERLPPAQLDTLLADSYEVFAPFRSPEQDRLMIPLTGSALAATPA